MTERSTEFDIGGVHHSGGVVKYGRWIVGHRILVVVLSLLFIVLVSSGLRFAGFTSDYRYFFDDKNPNLQAFDHLERTYSSLDVIVWALHSTSYDATDPRMVKVAYDVTEKAWSTPFSLRVDSYTNYQHTVADGDDLLVQDLVPDPEEVDAARSEEIKQVIRTEPTLGHRMLSEKGDVTFVYATLKLDRGDPFSTAHAMAYANSLAEEIEAANPEIEVYVSGIVGVANAFSSSAQRDVKTLFPAMILVLTVVLFVLSRTLTGTLAALFVVLSSSIMALAMSGWLGIKLTPPSANTPVLVLTVAVADCIHILISTLVGMHRGLEKKDAIVDSLRINWGPVFLTSVTTAIGFGSLNFMDAPPFRDMGNFAAFGAIFAWILSITLFPALLALAPLRASNATESQSRFMEGFGKLVIAGRWPIMVALVAVCVGSAFLVPTLAFNDNYIEYFDKKLQFRADTDWIDENGTGVMQLNFSIDSGSYGSVSDPDYLQHLDDFAVWARAQPIVEHALVFSDVMKRINKSMHGDNPDYYAVPASSDEAAQYLLLYEMSLPYGLDLNDQLNVAKTSTRVVFTMRNITTTQLEEFQAASAKWMADNWPEQMWAKPIGQMVMFAYINRSNFEQMRVATPIALLLISACLMIFLRSVRLGLISLIPNIMPPLIAFGVFALFSDEVGMWSSIIVATALGLIVDATVHFLSKYKRGRTEKALAPRDAILYAFGTVGMALFVATLVLIAGFSMLAFSLWTVNQMMGIMVALTVGIAFVVDFLLLPALLLLFDREKVDASASSA